MYEKTYHNTVLKKEESNIPKKRFSFKKILISVLLLGLIFGIFSAIRHPKLQVVSIGVSGNEVLDIEDIRSFTEEQLVGNILWFLPRTSILLVNESFLEKQIQKKFSRIESISIRRDSFSSIFIKINEFDAIYLWCSKSKIEECYFMDKQGIVYTNAPVFSGTAYPKIITDREVIELPFSVLTKEEVDMITVLDTRLNSINITPAVYSYLSSKELDIEFLHNKTTSTIKIDPSMSIEKSLDYIFSAIRTEPFSSLFGNPDKKLLYLDIRFPNKIIYKFE